MQFERNGYTIDDSKTRLDIDGLHSFIVTSYWVDGIPRTTRE